MKRLLLVTILVMFMVSPSFGFTWTYYDFGTDYFDYNNNWSPINYPIIGHQPAPGPYTPGGEYYDLENFNIQADNDYVYISFTNSFGYDAIGGFRQGDLFIGTLANRYEYAIDLTGSGPFNTGFYSVGDSSAWNFIQNLPGSYYSQTAIRYASGAHEINGNASLVGTNVWTNLQFADFGEVGYLTPGSDSTWIWEIKFDRSYVNGGDLAGYAFHLNVGCGNDLIDTVPEPTTMLLFGMGLLGTGSMFRRRKK